jgi:hypothetical protein
VIAEKRKSLIIHGFIGVGEKPKLALPAHALIDTDMD